MRVHYLASIALANLALISLLVYPFADRLATLWLPLTALPYFLLYARDLRQHGYRRLDVVRVYALNVLLVSANLGGVLKSLHQAVTGRQTPFKRTPKVTERTPVAPTYVVLPYALVAFLAFGLAWDLAAGRLSHAAVVLLNSLLLVYALRAFVGWRASWQDVSGALAAAGSPALQRLRPRRLEVGAADAPG